MQEWPLKSGLAPDVYGPPESAITTELVEREIKGFMTVDEVRTFPLSLSLSLSISQGLSCLNLGT